MTPVVIDTNVIVSGLLKAESQPAMVLNLAVSDRIRVLVDESVLSEYEAVLHREKFRFDPAAIGDLLTFLRYGSEHVVTTPSAKTTSDPGDQKFYDIAVSGAAAYLITGNRAHFPVEAWIVTPREFVDRYRINDRDVG